MTRMKLPGRRDVNLIRANTTPGWDMMSLKIETYGFDHSRKKKIVDNKIALQITSSSLCALYAVGCTFYYFELNVVL